MSLPVNIEKFVMPEPMSGCWIWLGALGTDGYGMGWDGELKKTIVAHRLVYQILVGPIPSGKLLLHRCDNPCCVNPDHMFVGTTADNNRDCKAKGRNAFGVKHGMNKLSEAEVLAIRASVLPEKAIAEQFGISWATVSAIKQRRLWKHLQGPIHRNQRGPQPRRE